MFTVCPKCALTLVVTAADLRVAQGYVRCGRCSSVFNALAQLSDERGAPRGPGAPPEEPPPEEPAEAPAPPREESIAEDALEFNPNTTDASSVFVTPPPSPQWTAATGSFKSLVAANQEPVTPAPESPPGEEDKDVDVELDTALLSDIVHGEPLPSAPAQRSVAGEPRPAGLAPGTPALPAMPAWTEPALEREALPGADDGFAVSREWAPAPPASRGPLLWTVGVVLLALGLVAQIINHQRDVLATDPRFSGTLTALYAAFGVRLTPRWDLNAYDVRQLGATVGLGSQGAITVRASLRNAGVRPQPLPLLRVTLQDRFGNRLASRDVEPRDYLPPGIPPTALLGTDQRIDAELAFVDPGATAVGFELDACLPLAGGGVACANDSGAR